MIQVMIRCLVVCASVVLVSAPRAAEFPPIKLLDTKAVDPAMMKDTYGAWEIQDAKGRKRCRVMLKPDSTIGGSQIEIAPGCAKTFPIMGEITSWRLLEGWTIDFVDALRKTRIRFSTPDNRYIAEPEADGIATIVKR